MAFADLQISILEEFVSHAERSSQLAFEFASDIVARHREWKRNYDRERHALIRLAGGERYERLKAQRRGWYHRTKNDPQRAERFREYNRLYQRRLYGWKPRGAPLTEEQKRAKRAEKCRRYYARIKAEGGARWERMRERHRGYAKNGRHES